MRTIKALITKEILVLGKKSFIPVWILAAIYAMILLGVIVTLIIPRGTMQADGQEMTLEEALREFLPVEIAEHGRLLSYLFNYILVILTSVLLLINLAIVSSHILNVNKKENYELFYRTQPVSIWRITSTKLLAVAGANWLIFFALAILNYLVFNIFLSIQLSTVLDWNFWYGFMGMLHWAIPALVMSVIFVALLSLISAIFQDSAQGKAGGIILGLYIVTLIFNRLYAWNIPTPFHYFQSVFNIGRIELPQEEILQGFSLPSWSFFFNGTTLLHILAAAVFFALATYLYGRREIK